MGRGYFRGVPLNPNTAELVTTACVAETCVKPRPVVAVGCSARQLGLLVRDHWSRLYREAHSKRNIR